MQGPSIWITENERNRKQSALFTDIIKEVYGADNVGIGHHLMFSLPGGLVNDEQPSVDTMIFDHVVAEKLWGDRWQHVLTQLALTPAAERDAKLAEFYYGRTHEVDQ